MLCLMYVFFFKQKTAYEMRISDWSSDVCSSDLGLFAAIVTERAERALSALAMDEIRARSLEETLRLFGRQLMDSYMSKALLGVFRIAIIEHVRFPFLIRRFYDLGPGLASARQIGRAHV